MKALRRTFRETYGFDPPKTRRFIEKVKPKNWLQRLWWAVSRHRPTQLVTYTSTWRRWKKLAKASDR